MLVIDGSKIFGQFYFKEETVEIFKQWTDWKFLLLLQLEHLQFSRMIQIKILTDDEVVLQFISHKKWMHSCLRANCPSLNMQQRGGGCIFLKKRQKPALKKRHHSLCFSDAVVHRGADAPVWQPQRLLEAQVHREPQAG